MGRIDRALSEMCSLEREAGKKGWLNDMHPLVKLWVTLWYIGFVISFPNTDMGGILSMALYPFTVFLAGAFSFKNCLHRVKIAAAAVLLLGAANVVFAQNLWVGLLSMAGLCCKGFLAVLAVYLLSVTTRLEDICEALRILHVPELIITVILLIYRYISVLLKETKRLTEAYSILAPNQKGIHFRAWGAFAGQLLLRSIDRAHMVYDSMNMRGYEWKGTHRLGQGRHPLRPRELVWMLFWSGAIVFLRREPLFEIVGAALLRMG
ncbi:MAG: energy-coupling factor transporter transmembrane protein EcfT [Roseburia sp.]|nr:energy-coupling factor transporter transmembrane protein EcfT [Roseburia sp.]